MIVKIKKYRNDLNPIEFLIDDEDYHFLIGEIWRAVKRDNGYYLYSKSLKKYFHQLLLPNLDGFIIDHINSDPIDNRKINLRYATRQQNSFNQKKTTTKTSSKFKGVAKCKSTGKWRAYINYSGKRIDLGRHLTENEAALAYNAKAKILFGEYAKLNVLF